jgi:hypothetical protein
VLKCPHCGDNGVSPVKKLLLGPIFENRCTKCRKHWGISHWSVAAAAAGIIGYNAYLYLASPTPLGAKIGLAVALVSVAVALIFLVPVVKK